MRREVRSSAFWSRKKLAHTSDSASGKTQLALQLTLAVQLPEADGGLSGSACYLTTHAKLPTSRLTQMMDSQPCLTSEHCNLVDIHTMAVPTVDILLHALRNLLPTLMANLARDETKKPVRLVIIDSISALFNTVDKPTSTSLGERSRALTTISSVMHALAFQHGIAFVVVNTVKDVFSYYASGNDGAAENSDIVYSRQSRWFNSDSSASGGHLKEAMLGLVWANQLNARIMLTRTGRRRSVDEACRPSKRRRTDGADGVTSDSRNGVGNIHADNSVLLRRFTVLFSSVCEPRSVDFIITEAGVSGRDEEKAAGYPVNADIVPDVAVTLHDPSPDEAAGNSANALAGSEMDDIGDDSLYWNTFNDFTKDELLSIDFDGLDEANITQELQVSQAEGAVL